VHNRPKFAGCALSPVTLKIFPCFTSRTIPHPTPQ
jgi:hypothetical protein